MTTSGFTCASLARAMRPLAAVPTTSSAGSPLSSSATRRRTTTASSTIRTRTLDMPLLLEHVEQVELGQQDILVEGLHEVFVRAGVQRPDHLHGLGFRR